MDAAIFRETTLPVRLLKPGSDPEGKEWDVVCIEAGWSKNGKFYSPEVLKGTLHLFKDLKARTHRFGDKLDHLPDQAAQQRPSGFAENVTGWYENPTYGPFTRPDGHKGEGVLARFHILAGHKWLRENLKDAWDHGKYDLLGFSIDARGKAHEGEAQGKRGLIVDKIEEIESTDIVTDPAAGGSLLRMVASTGDLQMDGLKEVHALIKENFNSWLEGFDDPAEDENLEAYMCRVIEANIPRAQDKLVEISPDDKEQLKEVALNIASMRMLMRLIMDRKMEDALKLIREMMASVASGNEKESAQDAKALEREIAEARHLRKTKKQKEEEKMEKELMAREATLRVKEKMLESGLPKKAQERLLKELEGKTEITDEEIDEAIKGMRDFMSEFAESKPKNLGDAHDPSDPARVQVVKEQRDKWREGWEGLFDNRWAGGDNPAFTSLHEAVAEITGKWHHPRVMASIIMDGMHMAFPYDVSHHFQEHLHMLKEGWKPEVRADGRPFSFHFKEAVTTSDFPVTFGDAMFRRLQKEYRDDPLNDWRELVSGRENLKDATNVFHITRIGGVGVMDVVSQGAPYTEIDGGTTPTEEDQTITPSKHGNLLKFTWEDALADQLGALRRIPRTIGRSANRTIQEKVWDVIDQNQTVQGNALISTANKNSVGDVALSYTGVAAAIQLLQDQTEQDSGRKLGLDPWRLIVATERWEKAIEITESTVKINTAEDATVRSFINKLGISTWKAISLDRFDANAKFAWFVIAKPSDAESIAVGFLGGRDQPDIFVQSPTQTPTAGAAFDTDAVVWKWRLVFGVTPVDFRWIAGSRATS